MFNSPQSTGDTDVSKTRRILMVIPAQVSAPLALLNAVRRMGVELDEVNSLPDVMVYLAHHDCQLVVVIHPRQFWNIVELENALSECYPAVQVMAYAQQGQAKLIPLEGQNNQSNEPGDSGSVSSVERESETPLRNERLPENSSNQTKSNETKEINQRNHDGSLDDARPFLSEEELDMLLSDDDNDRI